MSAANLQKVGKLPLGLQPVGPFPFGLLENHISGGLIMIMDYD